MITIELKRSTSNAFENVLVLGAGLVHFDEILKGEEHLWRLSIRTRKQLLDAIPFIKCCERLKHKRVYLDGSEQEWSKVFGFLKCYLTKLEQKHDWKYCHGIYDGGNNLWGCQSLAGLEFGKHGHWNGRKWIFNKKAIQKEAFSMSKSCEHCPSYDKNRLVDIVNALPSSVTPANGTDWCFSLGPCGPNDPIYKIERPNCTEIVYASGISMAAHALEPILEMNRSLTRKIPWQVAEWVVINGNRDHEVITPALYEKRRKERRRKKAHIA